MVKIKESGWFVAEGSRCAPAALALVVALAFCQAGLRAGNAFERQAVPAPSPRKLAAVNPSDGALSGCSKLVRVATEEVTPGTQIAVSGSGRYLASYVQTASGVSVTLRNRETGETKSTDLAPPALPPGIAWRAIETAFSPNGLWLAVRGVGVIWVVDTATGDLKFTIGPATDEELFPGKMAWADDELAAFFWPPESVFADAPIHGPVSVRIYGVPDGKMLRELSLLVHSSDPWTIIRFSRDDKRLALLEQPRKWPGSAQLTVFDAASGKHLWQDSTGVQDIGWSADSTRLLGLSGQLEWFDGATGIKIGASPHDVGSSEFQKLRFSEAGRLAAGLVAHYSSLHRLFHHTEEISWVLAIWRVDDGEGVCEVTLSPETTLDPWVTSRGELVTLEERYEIRPPLRLLKSSRIITYRVADTPPEDKAPKK
jgi:hypothetical protein